VGWEFHDPEQELKTGIVMERVKAALRLGSSLCLLALTACSGGGGGSANTGLNNPPANNSGNSGGTNTGNSGGNSTGNSGGNTTPTPTVSIGAPDNAGVTVQGPPPFNFSTNLPSVGTTFGLSGPAVKITASVVEAAKKGTTGTLIYRGLANGVPTFDISIPDLGISASNVRADGSVTPAGPGAVIMNIKLLNYTAHGVWSYAAGPGTGVTYIGVTAVGSGTPIAAVPTAGSANYSGGTVGFYYAPGHAGTATTGSLIGQIAISVNFTTGGVSGTVNSVIADLKTPWNDLSLSANINRLAGNASFNGTTGTSGPPADAGTAGFSSAATGQLAGAFFGPNAEEVGGSWTLTDPNAAGGGKTAFGAFGTTRNSCSGCATPTTIGPLGTGTFGGNAPNLAAGATPNFKNSPPAAGTVFSLNLASLHPGSTAVTDTTATVGGGTATFQGMVGGNYTAIDLKIPGLGLNASNLHTDGTFLQQPDGSRVSALMPALNYTVLGSWGLTPASGPSTLGLAIAGYQTPTNGVPVGGSAAYLGNAPQGASTAGFARGTVFVSSNLPVDTIGEFNANVNFTNSTITGSLTNMHTSPSAGVQNPWNTVSVAGTLSGASVSGTTSTTGAPSGAGVYGMSSAATGKFSGAFYGPGAEELGAIWTLNEATTDGGKAAWGVIGATKQ
jgi:hypothetical protein